MRRNGTGKLAAVRSSVETLADNRVKLTVELDEAEFETEVEAAFKRIARQVRIPGFRPGRAPRRLLEAQLGPQAGRVEALRASLPGYYSRAVVEHEVDVIDTPEIEVTQGEESGPVSFDAVVDVRPAIEVAGYDALRVEVPNPEVDESEIQTEIDRFRQQFAELSAVKRAAVDGDHLTIDISATHEGETLDGLTTSDYDYLLGTGAVVPEIDENLRGSSAGDILEFVAKHPDPDIDGVIRFRVLVKEVQQSVLPELDDEFVNTNTEFETAEEFVAAIRTAQQRTRAVYVESLRREGVADAIAALVIDDVPEVMVNSEVESRVENLVAELSQRGHELDDYLNSIGQSREDFEGSLRSGAGRDIKVDLALRAVAEAEGLTADSDAVQAELLNVVQAMANGGVAADAAASESRQDVFEESAESEEAAEAEEAEGQGSEDESKFAEQAERLHEALASSGRLAEMRSQISKRAALEWITERVELVDPDGKVIDSDSLRAAVEVDQRTDTESDQKPANHTDDLPLQDPQQDNPIQNDPEQDDS